MTKARDTKSANLHTFKAKDAVPEPAPQPAELRRKICILGSASSSFSKAPFTDESWEIWNLAWRVNDSPRNDLLFEIHHRGQWKWNQGGTEEVLAAYTNFLTTTKIPVYLIKEQPDIPAGVLYPLKEVTEIMGRKYYASSIGFMLGLVIYQIKQGRQIDEVGLWGIDLLCEDEFAEQRPNAEFLLGMLHAMGVKVVIPESSALLKCNHTYGEEDGPAKGGISAQWLRRRQDEYKKTHDNHLNALRSYEGARQVAEMLSMEPEKAPERERELLIQLGLTLEQRELIASRMRAWEGQRMQQEIALHRLDGAQEVTSHFISMAAHYERGGVLPE